MFSGSVELCIYILGAVGVLALHIGTESGLVEQRAESVDFVLGLE